ncbi:MAG: CHAD domain-containing protein [Planctomycetes bacterium]|nr:CHAD domain-containing protein [Planctomycetota bacterium]
MATAITMEDVAALCEAMGLDAALGLHAAAAASRLFGESAHVHGLTKTARPLVVAAAALRHKGHAPGLDTARLHKVLSETAPSLSASQRAILADAVTQQGWAGAEEREARRALLREVARRIAAVADAAREGRGLAAPALPPNPRAVDVALRVLKTQWATFTSRLYGLRYEEDLEYVHELRVALRRLRAALRAFRGLLDGLVPGLRRGMEELADALGSVRDADVFLAFVRDYAAGAPEGHQPYLRGLVRSERRKRRGHFRALLAIVEAGRFAAFRARCDALLAGGLSPAPGAADETIAARAPRMLLKQLAALRKHGRDISRYSARQQHLLRIQCKKLRYTAEFLADAYPAGLDRIIAPMTAMQDALGEVHDCDVYTERVEQYDRRRPKARHDPHGAGAKAALLSFLRERREHALQSAVATWRESARDKALRKAAKALG